jgi:CBS domain-containing protein
MRVASGKTKVSLTNYFYRCPVIFNMKEERARDIYVEEIMTRVPITCCPDLTAKDIGSLMRLWKVGSIIITVEGRPVGIVTEKDLVEKIVAEDKLPGVITAQEVMSAPVVTIGPHESVADAGRKMARLHLRRLPVVDNGELLGIITENDITRLSPTLIEITREWENINAPLMDRRGLGAFIGYCERCEAYSYDLRRNGGVSGKASMLCPDCRDLLVQERPE